jgi:DNA-binding NarL/FixJ family response regulator
MSWSEQDLGRCSRPSIALTVREQIVVTLMAQGLTDETIARQLDLSRRTICYVVSGLMARLGVVNRFQLALILSARPADGFAQVRCVVAQGGSTAYPAGA